MVERRPVPAEFNHGYTEPHQARSFTFVALLLLILLLLLLLQNSANQYGRAYLKLNIENRGLTLFTSVIRQRHLRRILQQLDDDITPSTTTTVINENYLNSNHQNS